MPDIQVEKESKFKKLKATERDELAALIEGWWNDFHNKRQYHLFLLCSANILRYKQTWKQPFK